MSTPILVGPAVRAFDGTVLNLLTAMSTVFHLSVRVWRQQPSRHVVRSHQAPPLNTRRGQAFDPVTLARIAVES